MSALPVFLESKSVFSPALWAQRFFVFLHFLCFSSVQFTDVLELLASAFGASLKPISKEFVPVPTFVASQTVLLRAVVPSSGFTITFRALLDSGTTFSSINHKLATVLFENGAECQLIQPVFSIKPFYEIQKTVCYRQINGLTLQSVEDESVTITTSVLVDDCYSFSFDNLPVDFVVEKFASLGLPMVQLSPSNLGRTMWSQEEPLSRYRVHMLIGQDLLNAHFNMTPFQPTYHISSSLAIIRTKMGLTFTGQFDLKKFIEWNVSETEIKKIKETLYPTKNDKEVDNDLSTTQKEEIDKLLTFKVANVKQSWSEYTYSIIYLIIFINAIFIVLPTCLVGLVLKYLLIASFTYRISIIRSAFTFFLFILLVIVEYTIDIYRLSSFHLLLQWLSGSSIGPDLMWYAISPRLPLTIKSDTCAKTVMAFIDTGSAISCITETFSKELSLKPSKVVEYKNKEKREFVDVEIGNFNGNKFTKVQLQLTAVSMESENHIMRSSLIKSIADLLSIPLFDLPDEPSEQLLIGNDLLPSLLLPSPSVPARCIALAANLNAIETRLGYYLQGSQYNPNIDFVFNWSHRSLIRSLKEKNSDTGKRVTAKSFFIGNLCMIFFMDCILLIFWCIIFYH